MNVLDIILYDERTLAGLLVDGLELRQERVQLGLFEQADALEHRDMRHGAQHVIRCEVQVEFAVLAHGETVYLLINGESFVPEFHKLYLKSVEETHISLHRGGNFLYFNIFVGSMRA